MRDDATVKLLGSFAYNDGGTVPDSQLPIARACRNLAIDMVNILADSPELLAGMLKLLEAEAAFLAAPKRKI